VSSHRQLRHDSKMEAISKPPYSFNSDFSVKLMITDINKFNDAECKRRHEKIASTHNYDEFKNIMQQRITEQQNAARSFEN